MAESNGGMQDKLVMIMVVALIIAVGGVGYLYGQLSALKGGGSALGGNTADTAQIETGAAPEPAGPLSDADWEAVQTNPAAVRGSEDADVVLVEFTDYQCPFCSRHFQQTDGQIQENYVDTGKIKYVIRDLPLPFHGNASIAAQAARCAGDQGKYWEMHDALFNNQEEWGEGDAEELFSGYVSELGMNVSQFDACVSEGKYEQAVQDDLDLASSVGASGTPTFFINGEILVGAQPYSAFQTAIDAALGE